MNHSIKRSDPTLGIGNDGVVELGHILSFFDVFEPNLVTLNRIHTKSNHLCISLLKLWFQTSCCSKFGSANWSEVGFGKRKRSRRGRMRIVERRRRRRKRRKRRGCKFIEKREEFNREERVAD
jgi:hypothetical protein